MTGSGFLGHVVRVTDGDTIHVSADLMPLLGIVGNVEHDIRLLGINAPEHGTPAGDAATAWMTETAFDKDCLVVIAHPDKYGKRVDATVWISGHTQDLATEAIAAGHALPWDGRGVKPI